jgi:hypothetical protein
MINVKQVFSNFPRFFFLMKCYKPPAGLVVFSCNVSPTNAERQYTGKLMSEAADNFIFQSFG